MTKLRKTTYIYFEFPSEMFSLCLGQAFTGQPAKIKKLQRCRARFVRSNRRKIQQIGKRLKVLDFGLTFLNISSISLIQKLNDDKVGTGRSRTPYQKTFKKHISESRVIFFASFHVSKFHLKDPQGLTVRV